jgi:hypothetical protein
LLNGQKPWQKSSNSHVLYQWDPKGCSNKVPSSPEAALRSPYDDQEAQALLLDAHCSGHIRSAIGMRPPKQRSNIMDHTMGGGDRPVGCWIHPSTGDQVSSTRFNAEWTDSGLRGIDELPNHWVMYFDGSYTLKGAGASIVLIPSEGDILKYAIQLEFPATNNILE